METPATTPTEPETPPETPEPPDRPPENREAEWKRKAQRAERDAADLKKRLEELETKDQSELERERKAREKAEQENATNAAKIEALEKGAWVRDAAAEAKFHNPSSATSHVDLAQIEDAADAARVVKDLAKREKWMVKDDDPPKPQVGQVLKDGLPVQQPTTPQEAEARIVQRDADAVVEALTEIGVYQKP